MGAPRAGAGAAYRCLVKYLVLRNQILGYSKDVRNNNFLFNEFIIMSVAIF